MPCRAFIFDLDDTLVHSTRAYGVAEEAALVTAGLAGDRAALLASRAEVKARLPKGHVAARNRWLYFKRMLETAGRLTPTLLADVMASYERALATELALQWQELKRARLLQRLSSKVQIAVVTNENLRSQMLKLAALEGADAWCHVVITSEECGVEKPQPQLLQEALRRLQVAPADVVVVGDRWEDDIEPALAAGCIGVLTTEFTAGQEHQAPGSASITSLEEVLRYVH